MPRKKKHTGLYKGPGAEALRTTIGAAGEITQVTGAAGLNLFGAAIGAVRNVAATLTGGNTRPLSDFMTAKITQRNAAKTRESEERNISIGETNAAKRIAESPRSAHLDKQLEHPGQGKKPKTTPASSATPTQRPDYIGGKRNYYPDRTYPKPGSDADRKAYEAAPDIVKTMAGSGKVASWKDHLWMRANRSGALTPAGMFTSESSTAEMKAFQDSLVRKRFGTMLKQTPTEGTGQWQGVPSGDKGTPYSTQSDLPNAPRAAYKDSQPEFPARGESKTPYQQKVDKLIQDTRAQDLINQMRRENLIQELRVDKLVQDTKVQRVIKKTKIQKVLNTTPKKKKKKK